MTRVIQAASMATALRALNAMFASVDGYVPLFCEHGAGYPGEEKSEVIWHNPQRPDAHGWLTRFIRRCDEEWDTEIHMGAPCRKREVDDQTWVPFLWVRIEGKKQLERAYRLKPLPTMVLSEGSTTRKLLIWWTDRLDYLTAEDLNKRIAYRLGAVQKHGSPERARLVTPGTCLRVGRERPVPIVVSRLEPVRFEAVKRFGWLRKPPEIDYSKWRKASGK